MAYENKVLALSPKCYWRLGEAAGDFQDLGAWGLSLTPSTESGLVRQVPANAQVGDSGAIHLQSVPVPFTILSPAVLDPNKWVTAGPARPGTISLLLKLSPGATWPSNARILGVFPTTAAGINLLSHTIGNPYAVPTLRMALVGAYDTHNAYTFFDASSFGDNLWHHVVLVFPDGIGVNQRAYLDGIPAPYVATGIGTQNTLGTQGQFLVGNRSYLSTPAMGFEIDEIAFFDRVLTFGEVKTLWERYAAWIEPNPNLGLGLMTQVASVGAMILASDGVPVNVVSISSTGNNIDIQLDTPIASTVPPTSDPLPSVQLVDATALGDTLTLETGGAVYLITPHQPQGDTGETLVPPAPILGEADSTNPPPFPVEGGGGETTP